MIEKVSKFQATLFLHVFSRLAPVTGFASGLLSSVPVFIGQIESEMVFASGMLILCQGSSLCKSFIGGSWYSCGVNRPFSD